MTNQVVTNLFESTRQALNKEQQGVLDDLITMPETESTYRIEMLIKEIELTIKLLEMGKEQLEHGLDTNFGADIE